MLEIAITADYQLLAVTPFFWTAELEMLDHFNSFFYQVVET